MCVLVVENILPQSLVIILKKQKQKSSLHFNVVFLSRRMRNNDHKIIKIISLILHSINRFDHLAYLIINLLFNLSSNQLTQLSIFSSSKRTSFFVHWLSLFLHCFSSFFSDYFFCISFKTTFANPIELHLHWKKEPPQWDFINLAAGGY